MMALPIDICQPSPVCGFLSSNHVVAILGPLIHAAFKRGALGAGAKGLRFSVSSIIASSLIAMSLASAPAAALDDAGTAWPDLAALAMAADATIAQVTIERRVIIRVPLLPQQAQPIAVAATPVPSPMREVAGPRCLALSRIGGAIINSQSGVMLVADQQLYRAEVARTCKPADFYAGFYLNPSKDGALCARRDALHARSGATCRIERFRMQVRGR
jgi:hypothetical protein